MLQKESLPIPEVGRDADGETKTDDGRDDYAAKDVNGRGGAQAPGGDAGTADDRGGSQAPGDYGADDVVERVGAQAPEDATAREERSDADHQDRTYAAREDRWKSRVCRNVQLRGRQGEKESGYYGNNFWK